MASTHAPRSRPLLPRGLDVTIRRKRGFIGVLFGVFGRKVNRWRFLVYLVV